ncbi:DUF4238 domain-containing protein [Rhizobium ruizarguesonis]|uniref:DUF4238 domain-containing protein n=1 Tax=Rhizobium leguminosarum TaxID=384 RepID=UPI00102FEE35|nr:DUF4238 domain-containing protein [Rhizobium leguminosarum]TAV10667.1 DUF4238 domain-containing protein [Rhizobium leguminosarum]
MAKGRLKKKQHYVPRAYLSAWTDPATPPGQTPYIWIFDKEGGSRKRKSPEKTFTETDIYTIPMPDGARDLRLEDGLQHLEQGIGTLRREFLEERRQLPAVRHIKLMAFLSAMQARTPAFREHHRGQYQKLLNMGDDLMAQMATKTPEERRRIGALSSFSNGGRRMTMDQVREIAERPIQALLPGFLRAEVPILAQMQSTIICATGDAEFITSDAPVSRYDPEAHKRPFQFRGAGLAFSTIEIVMPLSPRMALLVHHTQPISRGIKPIVYCDVEEEFVDEVNRRTRAFSHEHVVSSRDRFKSEWLGLERVDDDD